jgi:hypothetical protein
MLFFNNLYPQEPLIANSLLLLFLSVKEEQQQYVPWQKWSPVD